MAQVRPKKSLGQHFLTDLTVAGRIADTLSSYKGTPVIEVGPGMGVLTRFLLEGGHDVVVAELDTESVDYLRANFPKLDGRIIEGDFLKLNLDEVFAGTGKFCVIGNYPYNISSQIFFHVLEYRERIACCSGMLQKEVAERLAASPGTKARGILSVLLQAWFDIRYLFTVPPGVFNPPPKVHSGVVSMTPNGRESLGCDERLFKTVVKTTFGQRRKTIRNSIKGLLGPGAKMPDSPLMSMRPEQLSVDEFINLTNLVTQSRREAISR